MNISARSAGAAGAVAGWLQADKRVAMPMAQMIAARLIPLFLVMKTKGVRYCAAASQYGLPSGRTRTVPDPLGNTM
jgi:hypothetical protein